MLFVQNVRWVTVIWWYPGINRYPRRWVNGTRSYICLPQKAHFLIFYDFKSVRAGSKKIEETTSGKSCPKSHYFAPIGVSSLVLGYLLTSFGLPFMLNFLTLRNHIFCNTSPAKARISLLSVSGFCINCSSEFSFCSKDPLWLTLFSFYIDFWQKWCIWKAVSDPAGALNPLFGTLFHPKSLFLVRPSGE